MGHVYIVACCLQGRAGSWRGGGGGGVWIYKGSDGGALYEHL